MSIFKKLFGFEKKENTNTRTFANLDRALKTGYLEDYQTAENAYLSGNLAEALNYINSTIQKSDISDWKQYAFRANVYEDQKKYTEAITDYNKAIELSNSELSVYQLYHQIGYCYLNLGNNKKAEEFYTAASDIKKRHPNSEDNPDMEGMMGGVMMGLPFERLYNNRGNARKNLGKLQEGFEDCKKALEYNPTYSNPYLLAGQIQHLAGNSEEAVRLVNQSIKMGNHSGHKILKDIFASEQRIADLKPVTTKLDLSDYKFLSDNHIRSTNGVPSTTNNKGAWRGVRIISEGHDRFQVLIYNMNGNHPLWGDNLQMAPKQMKLTRSTPNEIFLQGYGEDSFGNSFADYALTLTLKYNDVETVTLHMLDRGVEILYLKA